MRASAFVLALLLVPLGSVVALPPAPSVVPADPLSDLLANATGTTTQTLYKQTGNNLSREEVEVVLDVDFRDLDFDMVGVVFGGGRLEAQARVSARLALTVLSVERVADAVRSAAGSDVNLSALGADRQYITANEFRATLAAEAIAAFEAAEQREVEKMIGEMMPDVTLLSSRFAWSGTDPREAARPPQVAAHDPRHPVRADLKGDPIVLDATFDVQYLRRESLAGILERALQKALHPTDAQRAAEEAKDAEVERLKAQNEGALYERSAFSLLGITQVLSPQMPPGWDLQTTVQLPVGYTIEYASADVDVDPSHQAASTMTLAGRSDEVIRNPVALSLSNRFLVTVALLGVTLAAGALLRIPVVLAADRLQRRRRG